MSNFFHFLNFPLLINLNKKGPKFIVLDPLDPLMEISNILIDNPKSIKYILELYNFLCIFIVDNLIDFESLRFIPLKIITHDHANYTVQNVYIHTIGLLY